MSTKFALLGLLNIKKMSAYNLAKFAKESIGYFWNESYSNVHRTLKILVDEELIKKLPEKGSRNKNIFEITDLGRQALSEWLSNHEHTTIYRDELLLKLFVSKHNDYPALLIDLKNALNELREQKQIYSKLQEFVSTRPDNLSYDLVLNYGIVENEATIKWLEKSIKRIEETL
ncbi:MAG: PadR family transcriptional regulator [Saccharofermentanales bacterium]|jgi:DNA-binding PadR family transcriptional regulator|nr:PadR family transcriptional regulator [Bacillota bacterium]NLB08669.1 PadR family transcriptional regulator [Clostridiales bacterium]